jgi:hypothetical protein
MFGSSVAAFYYLPKWLFYALANPIRRNGFTTVLTRLYVRPQVEAVVHWAAKVLLATEIPLCRLHRDVREQELNLLQFTTIVVAQFRTCSSQIVRRDMLQPRSLTAGLHHVPDHIL